MMNYNFPVGVVDLVRVSSLVMRDSFWNRTLRNLISGELFDLFHQQLILHLHRLQLFFKNWNSQLHRISLLSPLYFLTRTRDSLPSVRRVLSLKWTFLTQHWVNLFLCKRRVNRFRLDVVVSKLRAHSFLLIWLMIWIHSVRGSVRSWKVHLLTRLHYH